MLSGDEHVAETGQVATGVLDANDQALLGERAHRRGGDLRLDRARHVVRDERQLQAWLHISEVADQLALAGQEVERRRRYQGVRTSLVRARAKRDALSRTRI